MIDFLMISTRPGKKEVTEIYPKFIIKKSDDLMIRGGDFYAIWLEDRKLWSTDEQDALQLIDRELDRYMEENRADFEGRTRVLHMWDAESGMIDAWHRYCQKQMRDHFHPLDEKLIFANDAPQKKDYASKRLPYPLEKGDISSFDHLLTTLYAEEERHKIEWAIGSIVSGDSKKLQKFMVLYGEAGSGKSTVLGIIDQLFEGYTATFDAKGLGSSSNAFALESFRSNPLVAIQNDGDLSRIDDNSRLNSLISHEKLTVNEKFKSTYTSRFQCFLFVGTNKPVRITDGRSGLIRRLIDVTPSGKKLPLQEYQQAMRRIPFELGAIAWHCLGVYRADPSRYDTYIPIAMLGASNDFYNFVLDSYLVFKKEDGVTLKAAWEMYKTYCDEAKLLYPLSKTVFQEELKNYFWEYHNRTYLDDGSRPRCYYSGFRYDRFESITGRQMPKSQTPDWLLLTERPSLLDTIYADRPAQYASTKETPTAKWDDVTSTLSQIDTSKLHYVKPPQDHIVIDFDLTDDSGEKSMAKNIEAASAWPPTYAEASKSGSGLHLHYIYNGDADKLSRVYDDRVEVKVFTGNSSLRRKLTVCNDIPVATISSGLPLKGEKNVISWEAVKSEKALRTIIKRNLNKEYHAATKPSVEFIHAVLREAYDTGLHYDVTDMRNAVLVFAAGSTHNADHCIKLVNKMHFKSDEPSEAIDTEGDSPLIFFDVEVFPNLFLVNWKVEGEGKSVTRMINPSPAEVEKLLRFRLVGFNCRRYDNHILYARLLGYTNEQLYTLSQRIINGSANCYFGEAYNLSYTDVYDFSSKKQSLKKFEIELGIHHQELGLPWDQPVPESMWVKVAEYCDNDVLATEAVFNARKADFVARQILAKLAHGTVNDTTNSLSAKIIFGNNRNPQDQFHYRDLGEVTADTAPVTIDEMGTLYTHFGDEHYTVFNEKGQPIFPGYKYESGKSTYRGEEVGEGGYVYAEPGMYTDIALLDIASMHPSSVIAEELFGPTYTKRFRDIRDARIAIKHQDFAAAKTMLDGALTEYIQELESGTAWFTSDDLAQALKIVINSIYGLTAANFENPFRDPRNKDNIVAKRGALFMINLKHEVQDRGFTVAHIKTDSIKIPNATKEIIQFVMDYGQQYGYTFEHEATYDRMCLVNDSVYIAKVAEGKHAGEWTAIGTQFQVPYVFKKLFTHEDIAFEDMCETKSVSTALYLDMNESLPEGEHDYHFVGKVGQFCPIREGCNGGVLLRESVNAKTGEKSYAAATGSKGYRWMESEMVRQLGKEDCIDRTYYDKLVDGAAAAISQYGDLEQFTAEDEAIPLF